jgi:succinate dehydrogenase hydrophobic anchor subunit
MTAWSSAPPSGPPTSSSSSSASEPAAPEVRSWGWHAMQVTSWLLLVMLPIQLVSIWLVHDAGDFGVATFVDRWHSEAWRVFDWLFLVLALAHGGIGLSGVAGSLTRRPGVRTGIAATIAVVVTVLAVLVSASIFSFDV